MATLLVGTIILSFAGLLAPPVIRILGCREKDKLAMKARGATFG